MQHRKLLLAQLPLVLGVAVTAVIADGIAGPGTYDLTWNTIDSGGGTSTAGTYALSGTIGQLDAGSPLTSATYSLAGGFWPGATPASACLGDIGSDGVVNVTDLLAVIGTWGNCPLPCPPKCAADIAPAGGNCAVDVSDLLAVIGHWGNCPP